MSNEFVELTQILSQQLAELSQKNPRFSLRALARRLKVSPSHLSRVLRGQKRFSYQSAIRLSRELELSPEQTDRVLEAISNKTRSHRTADDTSAGGSRDQRILDFEAFRLVADWYHFPLLELLRTEGFIHDEGWIAKRLALPLATITEAIKRLELLGFVQRKKNRFHLTDDGFYKTPDDIKSIAIRKHHTQMLSKAAEALEEQDPSIREFQALNLAFDRSQTAEAKKAIRSFTRSFNRKFANTRGNEIYQLNLQFFALTKEIK